jgi:hypothetical protein
MMNIKLLAIESIDQYLSVTKELLAEDPYWFRGQSNAEYQLVPSLFRNTVDISIDEPYHKRELYMIQNQNYGLREFKTALQEHRDCTDLKEIDYLYLMQHFEIPTSLLDFTLNPLVALYFCVAFPKKHADTTSVEISDFFDEQSFSDKGGAIFCVKPHAVNNETQIDGNKIIDLNEYSFDTLNNIDFPICIYGNKVDKRMEAQEGVFVYYGNMIKPLDWYDVMGQHIVKIFVPNSLKSKFKNELRDKYNISHLTMFPDMKGVSLEIVDKMSDEFDVRQRRKFGQD